MSIMSQMRRKQSNFSFPKKRTKLTNEEFAVRLLRHVRKHLVKLEDNSSIEILNYLLHCNSIGIEPSKEYILRTINLEKAAEAFKGICGK